MCVLATPSRSKLPEGWDHFKISHFHNSDIPNLGETCRCRNTTTAISVCSSSPHNIFTHTPGVFSTTGRKVVAYFPSLYFLGIPNTKTHPEGMRKCTDITLTTQHIKKKKVDSVFCFLCVKQAKLSTKGV